MARRLHSSKEWLTREGLTLPTAWVIMVATALTTRLSLVTLLLALLVPWEASATCLTQGEVKKLVAETAKQVAGKKVRGKKKASLKQLAGLVSTRARASVSRPEKQAWDRLYLALRPLVTATASCDIDRRAREGVTAVLRRLLANSKPPVFDIVAVQYLAEQLARGTDDSWT